MRYPRGPEDFAEVFRLVGDGLSLKRACKRLGLDNVAVSLALDNNPELGQLYMVALRDRADYYAERALDIGLATYAGNGEPDRARVALDAIKWFTATAYPKKYQPGYKQAADADQLRAVAAEMTDADRARAIATLIASKRAREKSEIIEGHARESQAEAAVTVQAGPEDAPAPDPGSGTGEGH